MKSNIKSLKRDLIATKENSSQRLYPEDVTDLRIHTLKLNEEEVEELLAVREALHTAYETTVKSAVGQIDAKDNNATVVSGLNSLNLWLTSTNPPTPTNNDAIQLSNSVILYVKAPSQTSPTSSDTASMHWSSQEDVGSSAPMTRYSTFFDTLPAQPNEAPMTRYSAFFDTLHGTLNAQLFEPLTCPCQCRDSMSDPLAINWSHINSCEQQQQTVSTNNPSLSPHKVTKKVTFSLSERPGSPSCFPGYFCTSLPHSILDATPAIRRGSSKNSLNILLGKLAPSSATLHLLVSYDPGLPPVCSEQSELASSRPPSGQVTDFTE